MGAFEDVINHEFRWPRKGDKPFQRSDDWQQNARMEADAPSRMVMMMEGYKRAADLMVERAQQSTVERHYLVYPVIFTYRQFIELELKYLIVTYGPTVCIEANWKSHDLAFLWSEFRRVLKGYDVRDKADVVVERVVAEFAKIDPDSCSYRYPVDVDGNPIPLTQEELDLAALADVMNGLSGYFDGCDAYLDTLESGGS